MKLAYEISLADNSIKVPIEIFIEDSKLTLRTGQISDASIKLKPAGGVAAILAPILDSFADKFVKDQTGLISETVSFTEIPLIEILPFSISDMNMTIASIVQSGHVVEGKNFLKLVPRLSLVPMAGLTSNSPRG